MRDGRQAWMSGAPLHVGGPKPAPTTATPSWPARAGPQYSAAAAGGVLQRNAAPSVAVSGPTTAVFSNGQQAATLAASAVASAPAAGHAKPSTAGVSASVPTKCPFSSATMSTNSSAAAAEFNSQIKYATTN